MARSKSYSDSLAAAAGDDGAAAVQRHPDVAGDRLVDLVEEAVERALERARTTGRRRPARSSAATTAAFEPGQVALDRDVRQLGVGRDQRDRAGRLVDLAALDADEPVLDQVEPADALRAGAGVELWIASSIVTVLAVDAPPGRRASKVMTTSSASRGVAGSCV